MKLQSWQKKENVSNTELAKLADIHVSYITYINKGRRTPSPKVALRIEKITNGEVTAMELLYPNQFQAA